MLKSGITEEKRYMHMLVSNGKMAELHMKKNKLVPYPRNGVHGDRGGSVRVSIRYSQ